MFPISSKFDQSKIRLHEFVAHSTAVNCLCIGKKSYQVLATGGEDFKTNVWRIGNAANIWMLGCNKSPIECVCFDADEQCLVTGAMNGSIKVFDLNLGKLARNLGGHQVNTCTIQYHPYGEFIVSGSIDSTLKVWDVRNRACIQTFTGHDKEVTCARFSPDGRWVSSSSKDGTILIWDLVASKLLSTIKLAPTYVTTFEFNPAEFVLAAATSSRTVKLWDLDTMEVIRTTNADSQPIKSIAFSNDGLNIYSATRNSLKKWNWNNGCKLITSNDMSWENVNELHITTENKALAGACNCNFVSIWSVDLNVNPSVMKNPTDNIQKNDRNSNGLARVNSISNQKLSNETDSSPRPRNRNNSDGREEKNSRNDIYAPVSDYSPASAKAAATAHEINQLLEERDSKNGSGRLKWESEIASRDVANSLSESLWKKYKDEQKLREDKGVSPEEEKFIEDEDENDYEEDEYDDDIELENEIEDLERKLDEALAKESNQPNRRLVDDLNAMLPPSSFPKPPSNSSEPKGSLYENGRERQDNPILKGNMIERTPIVDAINKRRHGEDMKEYMGIIGTPVDFSGPSGPVERFPRGGRRAVSNSRVTSASDETYLQECSDKMRKIIADSDIYVAALTQRLAGLRLLHRLWEKNEMDAILDHMSVLQEGAALDSSQLLVLSDFLSAVDLKDVGLTLHACLQYLRLLDTMIAGFDSSGWKSSAIVSSVLKTLITLLEGFGNLIKQTRSVISIGGVDLSAEERLQKCNACYQILYRIRGRMDQLRHQHRKDSAILTMISTLQPLLDHVTS